MDLYLPVGPLTAFALAKLSIETLNTHLRYVKLVYDSYTHGPIADMHTLRLSV